MGYGRNGVVRLNEDSAGGGSGFLEGIGNPNFGPQPPPRPAPRHPTGQVPTGPTGSGNAPPDYDSIWQGPGGPGDLPYDPWAGIPFDPFNQPGMSGGSGGSYTQRSGGVISSGGSIADQNTKKYPTYNEPGIPDMRDLGDVERYMGEKWSPSQTYESTAVDTGALIDATDALLKERMGGEMAEAARRFGKLGALQSGGGLGGGYVGTLGESERGYRRDYGEMAHRYRFQAEQSDAERKARAHEGAMGRELSAHEGYESKRQRDIEMANDFMLGKFDREAAYDRDRYGMEVGAAGREQQDAIAMLQDIYGG